jgi:hypothetical protein
MVVACSYAIISVNNLRREHDNSIHTRQVLGGRTIRIRETEHGTDGKWREVEETVNVLRDQDDSRVHFFDMVTDETGGCQLGWFFCTLHDFALYSVDNTHY